MNKGQDSGQKKPVDGFFAEDAGMKAVGRTSAGQGAELRAANPPRLVNLASQALAAVLPDDSHECDALFEGPSWHDTGPADQRLGFWMRRHTALGPRERRWISDRVFEVLRQGRTFEQYLKEATGRLNAQDEASAQGADGAQMRNTGSRESSSALDPGGPRQSFDALIQLADEVLTGQAPDYEAWRMQQAPAVRFSLPDWYWQQLQATHGEAAEALAANLLKPAAIEIRANLLRGKANALAKVLAEAGIPSNPVDGVPTALRLQGRPALARLPQFEAGYFEVQDAGSQAIVDFTGARRGERIIDFCAGAGGKTLALAARMRNQGQILAFDTEDARLAKLGPRLKRARIDIVSQLRLQGANDPRLARYRGWADRVLIDAPCSGSGTLRRHPDLKWRLQPEDIARYQQLQRDILRAALALLRPGGTLVYATCSLLDAENGQQVGWLARDASSTQLQLEANRYWLPADEGGDAFFMARWTLPQAV